MVSSVDSFILQGEKHLKKQNVFEEEERRKTFLTRKRKRRKVFEEGKYFLWRRRKRREIFKEGEYFYEGEGKGGKYLNKENISKEEKEKEENI